ncbi:hypothetical protein AURDEDRAFT_42923, partial [Auricularia subglabra TFB-10046 SS5]
GRKTQQIATDLDMSLRVVEHILHLWREIWDVCRMPMRLAHARTLKPEHAEHILSLVERNPDIYLDKIQEQLLEQYDVMASLSAIWRTLKALGITNKRV